MEPTLTKNVLISTTGNGTSNFKQVALKDIYQKFSQASQLLENWITDISNFSSRAEHKDELVTSLGNDDLTSHNQISGLKLQLKTLQSDYAAAEERNRQVTADSHLQKQEIQQKYTLLQNRYVAAEEQIQQTAAAAQAHIEELEHKHKLLQLQNTTSVQQHQLFVEEEQSKFQAQSKLMQTHLRYRSEVATVAENQVSSLRNLLSEIQRDTTTQIRAFQTKIDYYNTQLNKLAPHVQDHPNWTKELAKIEAFDLWIQGRPETETQLSAETLLHRVTTKINHTLRNLKAELYQATTKRDELQTKFEQQEEERNHPYAWKHLLGFDKIEDPRNAITVTMKNLAPPISIFQYYQAYKPMILNWSGLPDIQIKSHLSQEQF